MNTAKPRSKQRTLHDALDKLNAFMKHPKCEEGIEAFMEAVKELNGAYNWVEAKRKGESVGKTPVSSATPPKFGIYAIEKWTGDFSALVDKANEFMGKAVDRLAPIGETGKKVDEIRFSFGVQFVGNLMEFLLWEQEGRYPIAEAVLGGACEL